MSGSDQSVSWRRGFQPTARARSTGVDRLRTRLTASSSGLQPYELIVVTNPELRAQIKPHAWGQQQITDCSHLLVFAAWDTYTADRINEAFDLMHEGKSIRTVIHYDM